MDNCLTRCDALGTIVGFRMDGHNRKRSTLGAILTILLVFTSLLTLGFFGYKYINKSEAFQKAIVENFQDGQTLILDDSKFHFAAKFQTYNIPNYLEAWKYHLYYVSLNLDTTTEISRTSISAEKCQKDKWIGVGEEYEINKLNDCDCYNVGGYKLSGNNHYGIINKLEMEITINDSVLQNHELQADIIKETHEFPPKFMFYYYNSMFSSTNKAGSEAVAHFIDLYSYEIYLETYKETSLYISEDELITVDDHLIINKERKVTAYNTKYTSERSMVRSKISNVNFVLDINPSTIKNTTVYSYMSFSEAVARIGGIINILLLFFTLIIYVRNYWEFEYKMTQKYFNKINEDITINKTSNKSWVDKKSDSKSLQILTRKSKKSGIEKEESYEKFDFGRSKGNIVNDTSLNKLNLQENSELVNRINLLALKSKNIGNDISQNADSIQFQNNDSEMNEIDFKINVKNNNKDNRIFTNSNLNEINEEAMSPNNSRRNKKDKKYMDDDDNEDDDDEEYNARNIELKADRDVVDQVSNIVKKANNENVQDKVIPSSQNLNNLANIKNPSSLKNISEVVNNVNSNAKLKSKTDLNVKNFSDISYNNKNSKQKLNSKNDILENLRNNKPATYQNNDFNFEERKRHNSIPKYIKHGTLPQKVKDVSFTDWLIMKYFQFFVFSMKWFTCRELPLKSTIYNKIEEYLNKALNIEEIEQRYMELEMIKLMIFDDDQLRAFQNISFLKGVEDITNYQANLRSEKMSENTEKVDKNLEKSLQNLFARGNVLDAKLQKYFE